MELSYDEEDVFQEAFSILCPEKDGSVTIKEMGNFMHALGKQATEPQLQSMINEVDTDGNGFIDFNEFVQALAMRMCGNLDDDELRDAFRIYDKDNTGYITVDQVHQVFVDLDQLISDEEIEEYIRDYDEDNDGRLNYEEFVQMMTSR